MVATQHQLIEAGLATDLRAPAAPWLRIQASRDASTMWYAVMRKRLENVFIGTLTIRHGGHHAYLLEHGWEEIPVPEIGVS